jgi:hypothetical protein
MLQIKEKKEGIVFKIQVQPRSSKNMLVGLMGDALKIKLTAPPVDNAANKLCIEFLAGSLKVSKSMLQIVSGHTNKIKQVLLRYPANCKTDEEKAIERQRILSLLPKNKKTS